MSSMANYNSCFINMFTCLIYRLDRARGYNYHKSSQFREMATIYGANHNGTKTVRKL